MKYNLPKSLNFRSPHSPKVSPSTPTQTPLSTNKSHNPNPTSQTFHAPRNLLICTHPTGPSSSLSPSSPPPLPPPRPPSYPSRRAPLIYTSPVLDEPSVTGLAMWILSVARPRPRPCRIVACLRPGVPRMLLGISRMLVVSRLSSWARLLRWVSFAGEEVVLFSGSVCWLASSSC